MQELACLCMLATIIKAPCDFASIKSILCERCAINHSISTLKCFPFIYGVIHAVTGKRKRQEEFQSRKRQAPSAPVGISNQAAATQHLTTNPPEPAASLDAQVTQHKADAAVSAVGSSTPSSPDNLIMPTASPHTASVAFSNLPEPQLQDEMSLAPGTDASDPAVGAVTSPLPASQTAAQAAHMSNGQGTVPGLQDSAKGSRQEQPSPQRCVVAKPVNDARGHTGYLTFARRSVDD